MNNTNRSLLFALMALAVLLSGCATVMAKSTDFEMVNHLQADMPEQDVYMSKGDMDSSMVMRVDAEIAAMPDMADRMVYASAEMNEHDPFMLGEAPLGPVEKGDALGFTLAEWLSATGKGTYTVIGDQAKIDLSLANLVPSGVYTLWCAYVKLPPEFLVTDYPCGEPDGSGNVFTASEDGSLEIHLLTNPLHDTTDTRLAVLGMAYHSDGKSYGMFPGEFGHKTHVQLFYPLPPRGDLAWNHHFAPAIQTEALALEVAPAQDAATMAAHNEALIRRLMGEGWNEGNIEIVDEFVAPDFIDHHLPPELPAGPEGIKQWHGIVSAAFSNFEIKIEDTVAAGDRVAFRLTFTGDHTGEFAGAAATGKRVTTTGIAIYHFEDGMLVEAWENADMLGLLQQIEALPAIE